MTEFDRLHHPSISGRHVEGVRYEHFISILPWVCIHSRYLYTTCTVSELLELHNCHVTGMPPVARFNDM